jgi:hypothetical protein
MHAVIGLAQRLVPADCPINVLRCFCPELLELGEAVLGGITSKDRTGHGAD